MRWGTALAPLLGLASWLVAGCGHRAEHAQSSALRGAPEAVLVAQSDAEGVPLPPKAPELPRVDAVPVPGDLPVYVLHGDHAHRMNILFLQGKCSRSEMYAEALTPAAAAHGNLFALQADVPCPDGTRRWSSDTVLMSERIDRGLAAEKMSGVARDLVLVGFSQGAERIEWFAAQHPDRVRGVILMSGPVVPSVKKLAHVRAAVFTAGALEWQGNMREGAAEFRAAGIPATFIELPGIGHGHGLGPDAERVMNEAFDFIEAHADS